MSEFQVRTDLALEEKESFPGDGGEISGVELLEEYDKLRDVKVTRVRIINKAGAEAMGKPVGNYITLESQQMKWQDEDYHREISVILSKEIKALIPKKTKKDKMSILVAGLGNHQVTSDSLGPRVVDNLLITRHLEQDTKYGSPLVSSIIPGVMAMTGMETAEIIKGIVNQTRPDCVVAIDALAARSVIRLGTTIQVSDTGIHPGSGVGNHRHSLTEESLGVPVIAIGVPTVVSAVAIVYDTTDALIELMRRELPTPDMAEQVESMDANEKMSLIRKLMEPSLGPMFVTPKDSDERVKNLSFTISEGLNICFAGQVVV